MDDEIWKWLLTILSATLAAYLGSIFALRKTKIEKLWLQKQEAYLNIIDSIYNIIQWADEEYIASFPYPIPFPSAGKEGRKELRIKQKISLDTLRKHVHLGGLIVSKEMSSKLEALLKEYDNQISELIDEPYEDGNAQSMEMISEHYTNISEITAKYINEVRELAKKDLGL